MKRPARQIIDTIEYNLKQLDGLSIAEPNLLKETTDTRVEPMEQIKAARLKVGDTRAGYNAFVAAIFLAISDKLI
jgi:voltage-gated potassium channel